MKQCPLLNIASADTSRTPNTACKEEQCAWWVEQKYTQINSYGLATSKAPPTTAEYEVNITCCAIKRLAEKL